MWGFTSLRFATTPQCAIDFKIRESQKSHSVKSEDYGDMAILKYWLNILSSDTCYHKNSYTARTLLSDVHS